jgi:hypothetical protein
MDSPGGGRGRRRRTEAPSTDDAALAPVQAAPEAHSRLAEIDPYGETVFNKPQIPAVTSELEAVPDETVKRSEQPCARGVVPARLRAAGDRHRRDRAVPAVGAFGEVGVFDAENRLGPNPTADKGLCQRLEVGPSGRFPQIRACPRCGRSRRRYAPVPRGSASRGEGRPGSGNGPSRSRRV